MSDDETKIYLARHEHGYIKIGKSNDPLSRIRELQTASPYKIHLAATITVYGDWHAVEERLHEVYSRYHKRGEWFDLPDHAVEDLVEASPISSETVERVDQWTPQKQIKERQGTREEWLLDGNYTVDNAEVSDE